MEKVSYNIMTLKQLNEEEFGRKFFSELKKHNLEPSVIGEYEPLVTPYSFDSAMELWTHEDDGCYDELKEKMVGKSGYMLAKNKSLNVYYSSSWWRWPDREHFNHLNFWVSVSKYPKVAEALEDLFITMVDTVEAVYAYISHSIPEERQLTAGGLENRIPGMFWCNYFNQTYIDFFGRDKFAEENWKKVVALNGKGLFVYLDDHPFKQIVADPGIEEHAKFILGPDSFGNKQEEMKARTLDPVKWLNNPAQHKRVPKII